MRRDGLFTVMSADLRDFTALSERISPERTYAFINEFLSMAAPIISANNGFINNFLGDAFIAVFPELPSDAVICAQQIQEKMMSGELFTSFKLKNAVKLGIGIDFGAVTVGIQGGETRMENTLLGSTPRCAQRLEDLTKETGAAILISQRVKSELPEHLRKGRSLGNDYKDISSLQVYEIYPTKETAETMCKRKTESQISEIITAISTKNFTEAQQRIHSISKDTRALDRAFAYLQERINDESTDDSSYLA